MIGEALRKLLNSPDGEPTAEDVEARRREISAELVEARDHLDSLQRARRDLLLAATDEDLEAHAQEVAAAELRIEALEERARALAELKKEREISEAFDLMPARLEGMEEALADYEAAAAAANRARAALHEAAEVVGRSWGLLELRRPGQLHRLPEVPASTVRRVNDVIPNLNLRLPRPERPDPNPKMIVVGGDGDADYELRGDWSEEERRRHGPAVRRVRQRRPKLDLGPPTEWLRGRGGRQPRRNPVSGSRRRAPNLVRRLEGRAGRRLPGPPAWPFHRSLPPRENPHDVRRP